MVDFGTFTKIVSKNVGNLGKLIFAKGFKTCPKSNKTPNLVTQQVSCDIALAVELF